MKKTTGEIQNLYAGDFVALGDAYQISGDGDKSKNYLERAVEVWKNLERTGKLYPNQYKNLA